VKVIGRADHQKVGLGSGDERLDAVEGRARLNPVLLERGKACRRWVGITGDLHGRGRGQHMAQHGGDAVAEPGHGDAEFFLGFAHE
jgi:hypothetical protein